MRALAASHCVIVAAVRAGGGYSVIGVVIYWTVIVPFMPRARCGVQLKAYFPGFTPANETV